MSAVARPDTFDLDFAVAGEDRLAATFRADYFALPGLRMISESPAPSADVARLQRRVSALERELACLREQLRVRPAQGAPVRGLDL